MSLIYHYTNTKGLMGILNLQLGKVVLWLSRADCLNDITEGKEVERILKIVAKEMLDNNEITEKEFDCINDMKCDNRILFAKTFYERDSKPVTQASFQESDDYILSFCKKPNTLEMWRYYSKGETGYCLGFDQSALQFVTHFDPFTVNDGKNSKIEWLDVVYDDSIKKEKVKNSIKETQEIISKIYKIYKQEYLNAFKIYLSSLLKKYQYTFKHECFKNEDEIRVVISVPKKKKVFEKSEDFEIKFRNSDEMIIPYIEYEFPKKCLKSVMISPLSNDNTKNSTQDYIKAFTDESDDIIVEKSELPIRF